MPEITELTDAEKLAALETYVKVLKGLADQLRTDVTDDMGKRRVEKVGAYLPDGTKMASVSYMPGRKTVKVTDPAEALAWCLRNYPDEIVQAINPAFLKKLTDIAGSLPVGSKGLDPSTGEELAWIEVQQGNPFATVTTTADGRERMTALANGFAGMLTGPEPQAAPAPEAPAFPDNDPFTEPGSTGPSYGAGPGEGRG